MDREIRAEAIRQYFRYFRVWFIVAAVMFVLFIPGLIRHLKQPEVVRENTQAPSERVYDYADVLTDEEEASLRELITQTEAVIHCDLVLVTMKENVGAGNYEWETNMRNLADDLYDEWGYGFNKVHGDGALLLDNWYEGQAGSWLSTCGEVYEQFGDAEINSVLDAVYEGVLISPYEGYKAYIEQMGMWMNPKIPFPFILVLIPLIVMFIFVASKRKNPMAENTTVSSSYLGGRAPFFRIQNDVLARKFVTTRRIPRNTSSGSGSSSGGGHVSRGGVTHGGGGRRR